MEPKTGPKSSPNPDPIPYLLKIGSSAPNPIIYNTKWHSGHPKSAPKSIQNPSKIDSESDQKSHPENDPSWSRLELRFWSPRRLKTGSRGPKTGSRGRQDGQDGPKRPPRRPPRGPKTAPRASKKLIAATLVSKIESKSESDPILNQHRLPRASKGPPGPLQEPFLGPPGPLQEPFLIHF